MLRDEGLDAGIWYSLIIKQLNPLFTLIKISAYSLNEFHYSLNEMIPYMLIFLLN